MKFRSKRSIAENNQPAWNNYHHFSWTSSFFLAAVLGQLLLITLGIQVLQFHGLLGLRGSLTAAVFILLHYALVVALVGWILASEARRFMLDEQKKAMETARGFLQVVRAQRHDLVSPSGISGLVSNRAQRNRAKIPSRNVQVSANANEAIQCNDPVLAAFLQARVHQAPARGDFELDVGDAFGSLPVSTAHALVGVRGNLLDNAFEAVTLLPTGQRKVMCALTQYDKDLIVRVRDSGSGITPEHRERIFDPDFTTRGAGRGLGLALVREMVTGIGGRVEVDHNPTTFTVWFPLREVAL